MHFDKSITLPPPPADFVPLVVGASGKEEACEYAQNRLKVFASEDITKLQKETVFLGCSLTERYPLDKFYPGMAAINRGIGGDTMGGLVPFGVYDRLASTVYNLHPKKLFLMVGINDLIWMKTVSLEKKFDQYAYLIWTIKKNLPETELFLVSVLPCKGEYAYVNEDTLKFNENIKKTACKYGAKYIDVSQGFKDEKGMLKPALATDDVHINEDGYQIITDIYQKEIFNK
jgi:lysophospholipase L1-like esterase